MKTSIYYTFVEYNNFLQYVIPIIMDKLNNKDRLKANKADLLNLLDKAKVQECVNTQEINGLFIKQDEQKQEYGKFNDPKLHFSQVFIKGYQQFCRVNSLAQIFNAVQIYNMAVGDLYRHLTKLEQSREFKLLVNTTNHYFYIQT